MELAMSIPNRRLASQKLLRSLCLAMAAITGMTLWPLAAAQLQAQTLAVLHTFTGGADGSIPMAGLTLDPAGNLYGTTNQGGSFEGQCYPSGCGVVFRMTHHGAGWTQTPLYTFRGKPDGGSPVGRVILGPDGALYGTTYYGGAGGGPDSCFNSACGTVFKLQPPPNFCPSISCPWRETILYSFTSFADGAYPAAEVAFDRAGNLYGTTALGGSGPCSYGCGTVFRLSPNGDGTWSKTTLYSFQGGASDGLFPASALVFDSAGNLYGTTFYGGTYECYLGSYPGCGTVFELTPTNSGWIETVLHIFTDGTDGGYPTGLVFDSQGNLYGAASTGPYVQPGEFGAGAIFELAPAQGGGWIFTVPYTFSNIGDGAQSPNAPAMDAAGNIYGSSEDGGEYGNGAVYKLTRWNGGWGYATLGSVNLLGPSGGFPQGVIALDAQGNLYGMCEAGPYPSPDAGTVWEITP
jgi:uncharacterized repeat protein (TIGR03803 family)